MRKCKNCGQEILISQYGLRNFCSKQCQQEHSKNLARERKRKQRSKMPQNDVTLKGGYVTIYLEDVNNIKQEKSTLFETQKTYL